MTKNFLIILFLFSYIKSFQEWWEESKVNKKNFLIIIIKFQAFELDSDNFDDYVGQKKYVIIEFFTKWCKFCKLLKPEYDRLAELYKTKRKDVIISRLEAASNDIISSRYGIYQYPIIGLIRPNSKRIVGAYQGPRTSEAIDRWITEQCPIINIVDENEIKKVDNNTNDEELRLDSKSLNISDLTKEDEFIKEEFIIIKKRLNEIEAKFGDIENKKDYSKKSSGKKHKKIRVSFDFSINNLFFTVITLLILYAIYKTGRKLLINGRKHVD